MLLTVLYFYSDTVKLANVSLAQLQDYGLVGNYQDNEDIHPATGSTLHPNADSPLFATSRQNDKAQ